MNKSIQLMVLFFLLGFIVAACASGNLTSEPSRVDPSITASLPGTGSPTKATQPFITATLMALDEAIHAGDVRVSDADGMQQIFIEAGDFLIGAEDEIAKQSPTGGVALPEGPEHSLYLDSFWIDKYEVTNGQYRLCVSEGVCKEPNLLTSFLGIDYYSDPTYADYPVTYVDYYMARDYCSWAGRRLPTEAEWEKAARGSDGRRYPWGNDSVTNDTANFCDGNCPKTHANLSFDDGYSETAPVGSYPAGASPYGVMDMAGNVWEWTSSIPQPYPYDPLDGREETDLRTASCSPPNCAQGETAFGDGPQRVWRGGTWANGLWWLRVTVRYHSVPGYWHNSLGFRCAQSP